MKRSTQRLLERRLRSLIRKEMISILQEDADASNLDFEKFPLKLRDTAKVTGGKAGAAAIVQAGANDGDESDDVVQGKGDTVAVKALKPSQTSMDINKATAFAIAAILKNKPFPKGPGGDLAAIISSDNHIMDGHHRWIASGMVDPTSEVSGERIQFPAKQLIAALNMITVALTDRKKGKESTGDFSQFNEGGIKKTLQKFAEEGVWSADDDPEKVVAALKEFTGEDDKDAAIDAAAKKMAENIGQLKTEVPSDFPVREDMPVISPGEGHVKAAVDLLMQGKVDLNEPYGEAGVKEEGRNSGDDVLLERWQRLSGLL